MPTKFDIICFSISRTDAGISSPGYSLAKEFAKTHRVFYIEHPFTYKDVAAGWHSPAVQRRRPVWKGAQPTVRPDANGVFLVTPPLMLPVNFLPEGVMYKALAGMNDKKLHRLLRQIRKQFTIDQFLFINFFDPFYFSSFPQDVRPFMSVYQSMDDIAEVPYTKRHGVRLEKSWMQRSTFSICTSSGLLHQHAGVTTRMHLLPNGVDETIFSFDRGNAIPKELEGNSRPIIGYVGSIEYRMDFGLIVEAAKALPDYLFCFVGPVATAEDDYVRLRELPNVLFIGPRSQEQLPAFLQHFTVACIPFRCNKLTSNIYPLKINEYLAFGKPVVSTAFSADIISFVPDIYIANSRIEFIELLKQAVAELPGKAPARMQRAKSNSWASRARAFFRLVGLYDQLAPMR